VFCSPVLMIPEEKPKTSVMGTKVNVMGPVNAAEKRVQGGGGKSADLKGEGGFSRNL